MEKVDVQSSQAIQKAQELIADFVEYYFGQEKTAEIKERLNSVEVYILDDGELNNTSAQNDIEPTKHVGGRAEKDAIYIQQEDLNLPENNGDSRISESDQVDFDVKLNTIIHEYAHTLRRNNYEYDNMFEEGAVSSFADACIMFSKLKQMSINHQDIIQPSLWNNSSQNYRNAQSQVNAILYVLNEKEDKLDMQLLGEYIFGDRDEFERQCTEIFGTGFKEYFELATSSDDDYYRDKSNIDNSSESKLNEVLSGYISKNGLNIMDVYNDSHIVLFQHYGTTLDRAVIDSGRTFDEPNEKDIYGTMKSVVESHDKIEREETKDRKERIKSIITSKYILEGKKNPEEIYDLLRDISSEYIQRKSQKNIESKVFISELESLIPNVEQLVDKTIQLEKYHASRETYLGLDMTDLSYSKINEFMEGKLGGYKKREEQQKIEGIQASIGTATTKEDLLDVMDQMDSLSESQEFESHFRNYGDFKKYFGEVQEEIRDGFNSKGELNYNTLYSQVLKQYVGKKEMELGDTQKATKELETELSRYTTLYKIVVSKETHAKIKEKDEELKREMHDKQVEDSQLEQDISVKRKRKGFSINRA